MNTNSLTDTCAIRRQALDESGGRRADSLTMAPSARHGSQPMVAAQYPTSSTPSRGSRRRSLRVDRIQSVRSSATSGLRSGTPALVDDFHVGELEDEQVAAVIEIGDLQANRGVGVRDSAWRRRN